MTPLNVNLFYIKLFVMLVSLGVAAYQDYRERLISDYVWLAIIIICGPVQAYEVLYTINDITRFVYVVSIVFYGVFYFIMYLLKLFAEADLILFVIISIFLSYIPRNLTVHFIYTIPGFLPLSVIVLGLIICVLAYIPINYHHNLKVMRQYDLGRKLLFSEKIKSLLMVLVPEDAVDNLKYIPGIRISIEPAEQKDYIITKDGTTLIWASLGIPVITFVFISLTLHVIFLLIV